jgi:predicted SnoaL-like aldol condensation-catalyzing enzyme
MVAAALEAGRFIMRRLTVPLLAVVVVFIGVVAMSGRPTVIAQDATPTSGLEANKALASRFHEELFDQGKQAAAAEILTPDFVWHAPPQEIFVTGPEAVNAVATELRAFIPDYVLTEDDVIAEGDRVVIRWTLTGTAQTEAGGVPVIYTGIDIFRIEDGQLAELWQNTADLELEEQLAATPAAGTPTS